MGKGAGAYFEHFHPISDKPRHTLFCKRLRDPVKLKEYTARSVCPKYGEVV